MAKIFLESVSIYEYAKIPDNAPFWVTHTQQWARVIEKSFPHIKGYIAADSMKICADSSFLPVYRIKRPVNKISWLSIPYATISDPVIKTGRTVSFLQLLMNHPLTEKCSIELRALSESQDNPGFAVKAGYLNHQIYLNKDEREIFNSFHRTAVQVKIRRALESDLTLRTGNSINDVKEFYRIYVVMRKELHLPPQPFRFFENMWNELSPDNNVELLLVEYNHKVIAGLWILKNRWLYSFEYLARACKNDKLHCVHFLYWNGIQRALKNNAEVVSLGRTSARNAGLDLFKRRWGTTVIPYHDHIYPDTGIKQREDKYLYNVMKKVSCVLPLPFFRIFGEIIYKFI